MILKSETYKKGIIYSSLFNVGGKSVAFIQQWLIGYYFGTHSDTDVFFFTYNIILFISYFFLNFTTSVLIPEGMKIRNQESDEKSKLFLNSYIQTYGLIGILLAIISLLDPISIFSIISSFSDNVITDNLTLITWCLPLIFLNITVSIMTEILASYKYFTAPNLVTFINYTFGILFIVFFHDSLGINVIAIGLIAGYLLNFFIILHFMHKVLHWKFIQRPHFRIKQVFGSGIYSQTGYIVYLVALYVPQYIFSQLPAGSLTAINFADKLLSIPSIFLVAQITNVMGIKINQLTALHSFSELSKLTKKLTLWTTSGLFIAALLISVLSIPIIQLLFSWGNYNPDMMSITARILSTMIFYLPFSFLFGIYIKIFNASAKQNKVFYLQIVTQGVTLALYFYLIPKFGIYIYPASRIIPYILATAIATAMLKSTLKEIQMSRLLIFHLILTLATLAVLWFDLTTH